MQVPGGLDDAALSELARALVAIDGVVAVVLGGSRARGTHRPDSDVDLGLYYRGALDVAALQQLATQRSDTPVEVTAPGGWGAWVDGGGWLTIGGQRVDWIYRDLDRVRQVWRDCQAGRYELATQAGHPLGYYSHTYAGELAICRVLVDPTGEVTALKAETREYPPALAEALVHGLWEAEFVAQGAGYGAAGHDPAYAAGCLFRAIGVACHALHGHAGQWLIHEKAMVAATARLPGAPPEFAHRVARVFGALGASRDELERSIAATVALLADVRAVVTPR